MVANSSQWCRRAQIQNIPWFTFPHPRFILLFSTYYNTAKEQKQITKPPPAGNVAAGLAGAKLVRTGRHHLVSDQAAELGPPWLAAEGEAKVDRLRVVAPAAGRRGRKLRPQEPIPIALGKIGRGEKGEKGEGRVVTELDIKARLAQKKKQKKTPN